MPKQTLNQQESNPTNKNANQQANDTSPKHRTVKISATM